MSALNIQITLAGVSEVDAALQAMRNALARRGPMHARMAVRGEQFTKDYLRSLNRHRSAERLGATPRNHYQKAAAAVDSGHDDDQATIRIPRHTGVGRAFGEVLLRPGSGRTYLTIPAHAKTYGKSVRDGFPEGTFKFAILHAHRVFPVLLFATGPLKGAVAYWLRRTVLQKQDRALLPSDEGYAKIAHEAAFEYLTKLKA